MGFSKTFVNLKTQVDITEALETGTAATIQTHVT